MNQLREYMEQLPQIRCKEYFDLKTQYGDKMIYQVLMQIICEKEKDLNKDSCGNIIMDQSFYQVQLDLWNQYGYCFSMLHYYPFYEDIVHKFEKTSHSESVDVYNRLSLSDEVQYGFWLLGKQYVSFLKQDGTVDMEILFSSVKDLESKRYVISLFLHFYETMTMHSKDDIENIRRLRQMKKELGDGKGEMNDLSQIPFILELQLYFNARYAHYMYVSYNIGLVGKIANSYDSNYTFSKDDFFQDGYFGLDRGVYSFDIRRGCKFSTYVSFWIHQYIVESYRKKFNMIKVSRNVLNDFNKLRHLQVEFFKKYGYEATEDDLVQLSGLDEKFIHNAFDSLKLFNFVSMQQRVFQNEHKELTIEDSMIYRYNHFEDKIINKVDYDIFLHIIEELLTPRERLVIWSHYGIHRERSMSYQEIANQLGCTRQRVHQIESCALQKIRNNKNIQNYSSYL